MKTRLATGAEVGMINKSVYLLLLNVIGKYIASHHRILRKYDHVMTKNEHLKELALFILETVDNKDKE